MLKPEAKAALQSLRSYAEANVVPTFKIQMVMKGLASPVGDDPRHVANLMDSLVVFSVEQHPSFVLRHASISVKKGVSFILDGWVTDVLQALGFVSGITVMAYKENLGNRGLAINFLQPFKGGSGEGPLEFVFKVV